MLGNLRGSDLATDTKTATKAGLMDLKDIDALLKHGAYDLFREVNAFFSLVVVVTSVGG